MSLRHLDEAFVTFSKSTFNVPTHTLTFVLV